MNLYFVKYYLDSKFEKFPILCTVAENLETIYHLKNPYG